jgi:ADP-ribosylglycohydrolase
VPGSFEALTNIVGGGPFGLQAGEWTDDTSMALCLAGCLVKCGGFDPVDQLERYVRWWREGHLSSYGRCFDIGVTVSAALAKFERTHQSDTGSTDPYSAGNGSIMRLAPVPLSYATQPAEAIERSAESSRTSHGAVTAVDACRYFGGLIVGAVGGVSKEELLAQRYGVQRALHPEINEVAGGSFKRREPPEIIGSGFVVRSLEAALWAFWSTHTFRAGGLAAANLGHYADTTAAVFGQLAGAFYGVDAIPDDWRSTLALRETIELFPDGLLDLAAWA